MPSEGYRNYWEYYSDLFHRLDLLLLLNLGISEWTDQHLHKEPYKGLVMTEQEAYALLAEDAERSTYDETHTLYDELQELEAHISRKLEFTEISIPLIQLQSIFSLTTHERDVVFLCLAQELKRKYEKIYAYLQDDMTCKYPTPDLMFRLLCRTPAEVHALRSSFTAESSLMTYLIAPDLPGQPQDSGLLSRPLRLSERVVQYLLAQSPLAGVKPYVLYSDKEELPDLLLEEAVQSQILQAEQERQGRSIQGGAIYAVHGKRGAGKLLQVRHAAKALGRPLLVIDLEQTPKDEEGWARLISEVVREALFQEGVLCFRRYHLLSKVEDYSRRWIQLMKRAGAYQGPLFLLSEEPIPVKPWPGRHWIEISLKVPDAVGRAHVWERLAEPYAVEPSIDWGAIASMFRFTPGQMEQALQYAMHQLRWRGDGARLIDGSELSAACYAQVSGRMTDKATRITPRASWSQLVLPEEQKELLQAACDQMKLRHVVYGDWGFERKLSYGKGLSMMFSGPPGTGKTMAAEVVACELNMEIYKIDLSQVISKYIGETEKNLKEIFDEARDCHAILFFDETDALLGKRSEVKDAHDKYANVETAYLLQKIEEYDGISVMATNYLQNIDEAFMRRLTYVIHFPFPDETSREQIWRGMFPAETPVDPGIDYRFLARQFQLSGGNIKNIVVSAAFLAAREQSSVQMKHIFRSIRQELTKQGKILLREDLREFQNLL